MSHRPDRITRELTHGSYVLMPDPMYRHKRIAMVWATVIAALVLLGVGVRYFEDRLAPETFLSEMRQKNSRLRDALNKAQFDLEVELATRGELERQVAALNDELKQVREELAFMKSAGADAPAR